MDSGGFGGLDIFKAVSKGTNKWGDVTNMGTPVNSEADDFGIQFEGNKDRGYLSSNQPGGKEVTTSGHSICHLYYLLLKGL